MTSILTNVAAMAALQTLRTIGSNMEETQAHVSSGLRVGEASDNAAYWSIATTMRSDNMALSAVQDALGLGAAKVDTAYSGMESAIEVVKEIKKKLVAASEDGVDKNKIQEEISQLQEQLTSIAEAASFSGENWLQADINASSVTKSVVASFVRDADGNVSVKKVNYTLDSSTVLFDEGATLSDPLDPTSPKYGNGILDKSTTIEGNGVSVDVNIGGTVSAYNVVKYTTEDVIADGANFDADGTVATGGSVSDGYIKISDNVWVAAVSEGNEQAGQEFAATASDSSLWAVDTGNLATDSTTASVSSFAIDESTTSNQISGLISMVDAALDTMTSAAADLGSIGMRIELQEEFVSKLTDSIDSGVGRLVDADMNEESTRLKALQTQQQLAIQSLSIANSASESILTLFR